MPSLLHEGLIALVRDEPAFTANLLGQLLDVPVPRFSEARLAEAALNELVPVEYYADAVVVFGNGDSTVLGAIVEAQLQRDDDKQFTWPLYAVAARARYRCPFLLIAVTPDAATASWARKAIDVGDGMIFRPRVIGPESIPRVTDRERALREPRLAVLSVIAHGRGDVETAVAIALAAVDAVLQLPEEQQVLYSALIESNLSEAARKAIAMQPRAEQFFSESQRRSISEARAESKAEGKTEGKAEGKAEALLMILSQRGLSISEGQRRRIAECKDLSVLEGWLLRALAVSSTAELLG